MDFKKITKFIKIENNMYIFIIILIGVMFMLFFGGGDEKNVETTTSIKDLMKNDEERLEDILNKIEGVRNADVLITYCGGIESKIAYDTSQSSYNSDNSHESTTDKQAIMSSGAPFIAKELYPEVKGVVVVANGASDILVKKQIYEAVTTAMGVASHKVSVFERSH